MNTFQMRGKILPLLLIFSSAPLLMSAGPKNLKLEGDRANNVLIAENVHTKGSKNVVRIFGSAMPGSGVVIEKKEGKAIVWTAYHVVGAGSKVGSIVQIQEQNGGIKEGRVIRLEPDRDIAEVEYETNTKFSKMAISDASSQKVSVVGFPLAFNRKKENKTSPKIHIAKKNQLYGIWPQSKSKYQVAYANETLPGMSGGAVLDENGALVAIHAMRDYGSDDQLYCLEGPNNYKKNLNSIAYPCNQFAEPDAEEAAGSGYYILTLGSRGINAKNFTNNQINNELKKGFIPDILDSITYNPIVDFEIFSSKLPKLNDIKKGLTNDQKLLAIMYYRKYRTKHIASKEYQEKLIDNLKNQKDYISNTLLLLALEPPQEHLLTNDYEKREKLDRPVRLAWIKKYNSLYKKTCRSIDPSDLWCNQGLEGYDYENYDAWNFYNSMLPATLKRIKNKNAEPIDYGFAAMVLEQKGEIEKAKEYALIAYELGQGSAEYQLKTLAEASGDYDSLLTTAAFSLENEIATFNKDPDWRNTSILYKLGLMNKYLKKSEMGCEIGESFIPIIESEAELNESEEAKILKRDTNVSCNIDWSKEPNKANKKRERVNLSEIGFKPPSESIMIYKSPGNVPYLINEQWSINNTNKTVQEVFLEMNQLILENGFKPVEIISKETQRRIMPYGCESINSCSATYINSDYSESQFTLLMNKDSTNISINSLAENLLDKDGPDTYQEKTNFSKPIPDTFSREGKCCLN